MGADLVALATPFIANPDLIERFTRGLPLSTPEPTTFYAGQECGYTDYPPYGVTPSILPIAQGTQDLAG